MKFTDILDQHGIPYKTEGQHTRPGWINLECCFCHGPLYLGYKIETGHCNCWRCGHVPTILVVKALTKLSATECKHLLGSVDKLVDVHEEVRKRGKLVVPKMTVPLQPAQREYLLERGFVPAKLEKLWHVHAVSADAPRLKHRIFIPIHWNGRTVSWTTRAIRDNVAARYISAGPQEEIMPHKQMLYGEDFVRGTVVVHEGPLDVWTTGPGAVATFGTGHSSAQVQRIAAYPVRYICFDAEPEAQKRARALVDALSVLPGDTYNISLDSKDIAEAGPKEIKQLRKLLE